LSDCLTPRMSAGLASSGWLTVHSRPMTGRAAASASIVELRGVAKTFTRGTESVPVLQSIDLAIAEGSFEALMGPSGSGKSTLLNIIAGIERPTRGVVRVGSTELSALDDVALARLRARMLGFIFQAYNLLQVLSAVENVALPLLLAKVSKAERRRRAMTALEVVGLADRASHRPQQLSGGQQQRVAIARAIINDPAIIVADEPTGDLDRKSADEILALFTRLNRDFNKTILMVTHDPMAAERATVVRRLDKGILQ
jgi:putative ABC transport system ATP-binding protein